MNDEEKKTMIDGMLQDLANFVLPDARHDDCRCGHHVQDHITEGKEESTACTVAECNCEVYFGRDAKVSVEDFTPIELKFLERARVTKMLYGGLTVDDYVGTVCRQIAEVPFP